MTNYWLFTLTSFILALTPGPDILFVITTSASAGFRKGCSLSLGLATGVVIHVLLIVLGISAIIAKSPLATQLIALFGAIYLLYMAFFIVLNLIRKEDNGDIEISDNNMVQSYYWRGVIMNVTNPKVLLFFLALFPQFAQLNSPGFQLRIMLLGGIFLIVTLIVFIGVSRLASAVSVRWVGSGKYNIIMQWVNVLVFTVIAFLLLAQVV